MVYMLEGDANDVVLYLRMARNHLSPKSYFTDISKNRLKPSFEVIAEESAGRCDE